MFLCIGTGGFDCGSNALINMMLGPKISRPYTQSLHTCVALGFAAGIFQIFVQMYLNLFIYLYLNIL